MQILWSHTTPAPLRGLALAREAGLVLAWDAQSRFLLFDRAGKPRPPIAAPGPLTAVAWAEVGGGAAAGTAGQVWGLGPDLLPRWERSLGQRPLAVAVTPLGDLTAASDANGGLQVLDYKGRPLWQTTTPRPLQFLAFVPEATALLGSAEIGLVCCYGPEGRCLWRDGLVAHVGSLATTGDGGTISLACFAEGIVCYGLTQPRRLAETAPCKLAALSYRGEVLLTVGPDNRLFLRDDKGAVRAEEHLDGSVVAVAVGALGAPAVVGLAEGKVLALATG